VGKFSALIAWLPVLWFHPALFLAWKKCEGHACLSAAWEGLIVLFKFILNNCFSLKIRLTVEQNFHALGKYRRCSK